MKKTGLLSLFLVVCLILSSFSIGFASASSVDTAELGAETETALTSANLYGLAEDIQQGQILQCWLWSYKNIEANLQKIAEQGFSAIQTSPIQPIKEATTEYWNTFMNSCWVIYQPVAFNIEDNYRNAQGTKTEFKSMCEAAHKYGIKVICDIVFNHMANDMAGNTIHPWIPSEIRTNTDCWHDISKDIYNFDNRYDTTHYCLTGLPDLNTANSTVQKHCTNLLKEAIAAGADGFRFDAAKHIETPRDASGTKSDFWPNVLNAATAYAKETRGITPYYYGEILGSPGSGLSIDAYTEYMSVTDPGSSDSIRDGVCNGNAAKAASGSVSNGASKSKVVQWTESHDNHKDNGTRFISSENINKTWAMVGAKSTIVGLYLARPENMDTTMMGDADLTSWTSSSVKAVNRFNNAFIGQSEYLSSYNSLACIERGTTGMIIVNTGGTYYDDMSAPVHNMASGTYKDAITGNTFKVSGGWISGDIGEKGIAVVYNVDENGPFSQGNITNFSVTGSFNDWNTEANKMVAISANKATTSMYIPAGTYSFKLSANGLWYGNSGTITDKTGEEGWTMKTSKDDNCTFVATGGKYYFTFDISTGKLVVEHASTSSRESEYYIKGSFNNWESTTPLSYDEGTNTVSAEVKLSAGNHTFKVNNSRAGSWYSNAGTISNETGDGGWTMKLSVDDNCTLNAAGGTYRFTLNPSTMKLVIEQIASADGTVKYQVTFVNYDGTVLSEQKVFSGSDATAPADPTRPTTAKHTYTFAGWDTSFTNVTKDITVTALYTQTVNKYSVTFKDYDGTVLSTKKVDYGTAATAPVTPPREGYTFSGWDKDFSNITGDLTVTALYTSDATYLMGTFNDWTNANPMTGEDGNIITTTLKLEEGTYTFKILSKDVWYGNAGTINDNTGSGGWTMRTTVDSKCTLVATGGIYTFSFNLTTNKLVVEKTADLAEIAVYIVTFADYNGTVLSEQEVEEGSAAIAPEAPTRPATAQYTYTFAGWDTDFSNITEDVTITATYTQTVNKYTVTFVDYDGSVLYTVQAEYGTAANIPPVEPEREGYTFTGWDKDFSNITEDITVTAQYTNTSTYLKGSFNDWIASNPMTETEDPNVLTATVELQPGTYTFKIHSKNVWYGNSGTISDATTGAGWRFKKGAANCTLNATGGTYIFTYNLSTNYVQVTRVLDEFEVIFKDFDGTVLSTQKVVEGTAATAPTAPSREATAQYTYTFKEWDKDFTNITADTVVTAVYTETVNKYTVTFKDFDGSVIKEQEVEYGTAATAPDAPSREGYTFKQWDNDFANVTEDITVNALYTQNAAVISTGTLRVRIAGGTSFTISIDGSAARPQGAVYLNTRVPVGAEVTLTVKTGTADFVGWVDPITGAVASTEPSYTFTASGNDYLNAVFTIHVEGVQTVSFINDKAFGGMGRILDSQYYASTDTVEFPDAPTQVGFDFAGWSMTEAQIKSAIAAGQDVEVVAKWTRQIVPVKVTVIGGSGTGSYNANSAVTVVADTPAAGEKFAYWTDAKGNIKSYSAEYTFYPAEDTVVNAVFADENTAVEYKVLVSVDTVDTTSIADKNVFTYSWYCPDNYTFVKAGIVAVNKDNYNEETFVAGTQDSNVFDRSPSGANLIPVNTFSWTKSNVTAGQTWMAKAYVQYRDAQGAVVTVYSDVVEATK